MQNFFLFTGKNTFELRQERQRWVSEFVRKFGEEQCSRIDAHAARVRTLLDEVSVMPLFAEKRLIVCEGMPKAEKEDIQLLAESIHPQVILLIVAPDLDKRTSASKEILKRAEVKEFNLLKGKSIATWIRSYAQILGIQIAPEAVQTLIDYCGEDQELLSQEMQKLALAATNSKVSPLEVEQYVIPTDEGVVWKIGDMLATGNKQHALSFAARLMERGGDAQGLWAILLYSLKNIIAVSGALAAGHTSSSRIAEETGIHPFAVQTLTTHARRISLAELHQFVQWAAQTDIALKTGGYRESDDAHQELAALIDRFITRCP